LQAAWDAEDHAKSRVAQLYGGYVLPGSRLDNAGGVGLVVSQWNTAQGWPYRPIQFKAALKDTTKTPEPSDPINL
jgi:D-arabinan endo alpha-(1,5)-arabinofuranosidase